MTSEVRKRHVWKAYTDNDGRRIAGSVEVTLRWVSGDHESQHQGEIGPVRSFVSCCADCGMVSSVAEFPTRDVVRPSGYGFDLDSLALRHALPSCEPHAELENA